MVGSDGVRSPCGRAPTSLEAISRAHGLVVMVGRGVAEICGEIVVPSGGDAVRDWQYFRAVIDPEGYPAPNLR